MKNVLIMIIFTFILATSCSKDESITKQTDENGAIVSLPYSWKVSLHEGSQQSNSYFDTSILYNNGIAIPTTDNDGNRYMSMIDTDDGDILWKWDDRYNSEWEYIDISYYHQYNNLLTYQSGGRSYCINLDDGTTHWKFARGKSFDGRITAYNDSYFCYSRIINSNGHEEQIAYKGDIQTGCLTEFLSANFSEDYISLDGAAGWVIYVVKPSNDDIRLLVIYAEPLPNWNVNSFMGMYNTQTQEWEYERKLMAPPTQNTSVFMPPKIYGNKVYANVGHSLVCHDLQTGEQLWSRDFTQDFMFSGFIIEEDKIIANNEDLTLYCLNPNNGRVIWTEESAGTSGRMSYLNGIVYFVGGSSGRLHAVDINTGEIVWKIEASNLGEAAGNNFKTNAVYVIPAKNGNPAKVIALSHLYAYCFEAYQ